jgi:hypothetical protein
MNTTPTQNLKAAALAGVLALTSAQAQTVETRIGKLEFEQGVPTKESVTRLYDEMDFQRACQAYLWALPIVSRPPRRSSRNSTPARAMATSPSTRATAM